jgi:hypothetical protein
MVRGAAENCPRVRSSTETREERAGQTEATPIEIALWRERAGQTEATPIEIALWDGAVCPMPEFLSCGLRLFLDERVCRLRREGEAGREASFLGNRPSDEPRRGRQRGKSRPARAERLLKTTPS